MESRNPVTCTSQYRANFFCYVIYTRAYRILHSLRARSLARTKSCSHGANMREELEQVLGKYSGLFQRVLSAIGRSASTRQAWKECPSSSAFRYCRRYLDRALDRLCVSAPVSVDRLHIGLVVHYSEGGKGPDYKTFTRFPCVSRELARARARARRVRHM